MRIHFRLTQMLNQLHTRAHVHAVVQIYIAACTMREIYKSLDKNSQTQTPTQRHTHTHKRAMIGG